MNVGEGAPSYDVLVGIRFSQQNILTACATETASVFSMYGDMADAFNAPLQGTAYVFSEKEMDLHRAVRLRRGTRRSFAELRAARDRRGGHLRALLFALGLRCVALLQLGSLLCHGLVVGPCRGEGSIREGTHLDCRAPFM